SCASARDATSRRSRRSTRRSLSTPDSNRRRRNSLARPSSRRSSGQRPDEADLAPSVGAPAIAVLALGSLLPAMTRDTARTPAPAARASAASSSYPAQIEAWRESRVASLTAPDGWLSVVGLFWL